MWPPFHFTATATYTGAVNQNLNSAERALRDGAQALGVSLSDVEVGQMLRYLVLLRKWNRAMNLTAIDDMTAAVRWHLLDSLAGARFTCGRRWLDVGSGAGLPGLPLAIAHPHSDVVLVESRHKRGQFLRHVVADLGVANVVVVTERVEAYRPESKFDTLFARAFAAIPELLETAGHLCRPHGRILVWKGFRPDKELSAIADCQNTSVEVYPIDIPGLDAVRHLVSITLAAPRGGAS